MIAAGIGTILKFNFPGLFENDDGNSVLPSGRCRGGTTRIVQWEGSDTHTVAQVDPCASSESPRLSCPGEFRWKDRVDPRRGQGETGGIEVRVSSQFYPKDY